MNPAAKLWCRAVQAGFRLVYRLLPYREPTQLKSVEDVASVLKEQGIRSVLVVTDSGLRSFGATEQLERSIQESGIALAVYDRTQPNPTVDNVEQALRLYRKEHCEALIAFGGGSPMDCAKAVGARVVYPKKTVGDLKGLLKVRRKLPPLIAIPTTAGTGSEVTITAVITDAVKKHKYTLNNFTMIPTYAVLDPMVTRTLPSSLTATTGMDALTHAVEAYIGQSTTDETQRLALEATQLIFQNLEKAYRDGDDITARANMLTASYRAGIAFSRSYVGYVHAVAHSLGGQYNVAHGLANAVLLPVVLEEYGACIHPQLHDLAVVAGVAGKEDSAADGARRFIDAVRGMNERMGIPRKLEGIRKEDIPLLAAHAAKEANPLYPVPKLMDQSELAVFYEKIC